MTTASNLISGTKAVFRHELRSLLYAPLSYLFLVGFLAGLSVSVFLIADFYSTDEASIRLMLVFLPWVAMILVPALGMGMWPGEHGDRSAELAQTLPLDLECIVLGKFLAGYLVLILALLFTLPIPATVIYLGEPDPGVLVAGYLASALLLAVYFSISLLAAALVRDQVGAFVTGLLFLFLLQVLGWDVLGNLLQESVPAAVIEFLAFYSPNTWLLRIGDGLVEFAGLFYFIAVTAAALFGAGAVIHARRRGGVFSGRPGRGFAGAVIALTVLLVTIPASMWLPGALDLTVEDEFTLHAGTRQVIRKLPAGTVATLYWSTHEASVPANIKSHARRTVNLLRNLQARSGGRLSFVQRDPRPDTEEEIEALGQGVRRIPMSSGDNFFFGLTVSQGGRTGSVPYFDMRRDRLLEYDVAVALAGLTRTQARKIGIMSPLLRSQAATEQTEGLSFLAELKRSYDMAVIPYFKSELPEGLDVLLIVDATILRREMLYAIDQFVMNGGNLIVLMDPYVRFNRASNAINPSPSDEINDISDILLRWGVRYRGDAIVGDARAASPVTDQNQVRMSFPFWLRIREDGLSAAHPATADLNEIFMVEPGALELTDPARAVALVTTSVESGARPREKYGDLTPRELALAFEPDGAPRTIAVALRGPFESAFSQAPEALSSAVHTGRSDAERVVFVVADVDWLFDAFSLQKTTVGDRTIVRPLNDNLNFLLNLIEYASDDPALIAIRSRGRVQRPFTRVAALFKSAERQFQDEEMQLAARVSEIEDSIAAMVQVTGIDDPERLPPSIQAQIAEFRSELLSVRRKLRQVRHDIRRRVERLGRQLTFVNLAAGPA